MMSQVETRSGIDKPRDFLLKQTIAEIRYDIWSYWSQNLILEACKRVCPLHLECDKWIYLEPSL